MNLLNENITIQISQITCIRDGIPISRCKGDGKEDLRSFIRIALQKSKLM